MKHLSPSSINLFTNCAEAGRRRYLEGEKIPPGWAAIRGSGTHKSVELDMKSKMATGELLPEDVIADAARDAVEKSAANGVRPDEDEATRGFHVVLGETKDVAVSAALVHHRKLAPALDPLMVEQGFEVDAGLSLPIVGIIDLVTAKGVVTNDKGVPNGWTQSPTIRDTKTSAKRKTQADADSSLQISVYTMMYEAEFGQQLDSALDVIVMNKEPVVQVIPTRRDPVQISAMWNRVEAVETMIRRGVFPPAAGDFWMCSRKWCGYYDTCPYAGGATKTVVA